MSLADAFHIGRLGAHDKDSSCDLYRQLANLGGNLELIGRELSNLGGKLEIELSDWPISIQENGAYRHIQIEIFDIYNRV
jgi:hypothetical protein